MKRSKKIYSQVGQWSLHLLHHVRAVGIGRSEARALRMHQRPVVGRRSEWRVLVRALESQAFAQQEAA